MRIAREKVLDLGPMGTVRVFSLSRRISLVSRQREGKGRAAFPVVRSLHGPTMGLDNRGWPPQRHPEPNFLSEQIRMRACSNEAKLTPFDSIDQ
jgi:hypothetical protein